MLGNAHLRRHDQGDHLCIGGSNVSKIIYAWCMYFVEALGTLRLVRFALMRESMVVDSEDGFMTFIWCSTRVPLVLHSFTGRTLMCSMCPSFVLPVCSPSDPFVRLVLLLCPSCAYIVLPLCSVGRTDVLESSDLRYNFSRW